MLLVVKGFVVVTIIFTKAQRAKESRCLGVQTSEPHRTAIEKHHFSRKGEWETKLGGRKQNAQVKELPNQESPKESVCSMVLLLM